MLRKNDPRMVPPLTAGCWASQRCVALYSLQMIAGKGSKLLTKAKYVDMHHVDCALLCRSGVGGMLRDQIRNTLETPGSHTQALRKLYHAHHRAICRGSQCTASGQARKWERGWQRGFTHAHDEARRAEPVAGGIANHLQMEIGKSSCIKSR